MMAIAKAFVTMILVLVRVDGHATAMMNICDRRGHFLGMMSFEIRSQSCRGISRGIGKHMVLLCGTIYRIFASNP